MAYGIKRSSKTAEWKKFSAAMSDTLAYAGEHLSGWAKEWMNEAVGQAISELDSQWEGETHWKRKSGKISTFGGSHDYPWYTGQLHDSVAAFVTDKNKLIGSICYMQQAATKPQTYDGPAGHFTHIIGREWAVREAAKAQYVFLPGVQARLVVGVPYARKVDEMPKHSGYLHDLHVQFSEWVVDYFTLKTEGYRSRVFIADKKKK